MGKQQQQWQILFSWAPTSLQMVTAAMKFKTPAPCKKRHNKPRQHIKKQRHHFDNKGLFSQSYGFSSSHVWMWEMDYKESWVPKNWCFWTVVLEKILESPLDCKETQLVNPQGSQSWTFTGRMDTKAEIPILWPSDAKNWLFWKDPDAGKDWKQEKRMTEDEMVAWHHQLDAHEFKQAPGVGDGQGSLVWGSPWGCKETTERLNWYIHTWNKDRSSSSHLPTAYHVPGTVLHFLHLLTHLLATPCNFAGS